MKAIGLVALMILVPACGKHKLVEPIRTLGPEWMPVQIKGSEQAWVIPGEQSSMLIDSQCHKRDQDVPLNALTAQLTIGMSDQTLIEQKKIQFQDREAMVTTFELRVEGVKQKMRTLVLKKDGCVFDVVMSTPPEAFEKRLPDFEKIQQLFTLEPGVQ